MSVHTIIQISDTHLSNSTGAIENPQVLSPQTKLELVFHDLKLQTTPIDAIAITGDLVHEGNVADYRHLKLLIDNYQQELQVPIHLVLGNHDRTMAFFTGYLDQPVAPNYDYVQDFGDYIAYFLDTKHRNDEPGYLDPSQLQWLQQALQATTKPALLFMHHPIYDACLGNMQYSVLQNGHDLENIIADSSVIGIFAGHIHYPVSGNHDDRFYGIADSTAYHIDCRSAHDHLLYDATAYSVITIDGTDIGYEQRVLQTNRTLMTHISVANTAFVGS